MEASTRAGEMKTAGCATEYYEVPDMLMKSTSAHCNGYRPASESFLVDEVCSLLPAFLQQHPTWRVFREVIVGGTIADVVAVRTRHAQRVVPRLSAAESVVLAVLRTAGLPVVEDDLVKMCGLNGKTLRTVKRLETAGLVRRRRDGRLTCQRWFAAHLVVAVEAKLIRWRDALNQAATYLRYADRSYVALPNGCAGPALEHASEFRRRGVGLLIISLGCVRTAVAARRSTMHGWQREFVCSRLRLVEGPASTDSI